MPQRAARNNVLAGLFVVISVLLAVATAFVLADRGPGAGGVRFTVRFTLSEGAAGLGEGSAVLLGGVPVGRVLGVKFNTDGASAGEPTGVDVLVEVDRALMLYENAGIYLEKPLLGTLSNLNIASAGSPEMSGAAQGSTARIEGGEVIRADLAPPGFLAQAGIGPEQVRQVQTVLTSLETSVRRVEELIASGGPKVDESIAEARSLVGEVRSSFAQWDATVKNTLANVDSASGQLTPLVEEARVAAKRATEFFDSADAVVRDNRQRIEQVITSVQNAATTFDTTTMDLLNTALRDARSAMAQAQQAIGDVRGLINEQTPSVRTMLANARLTTDQLKLTALEVRSQPWRLLYEPKTKELEQQVLYDSTRAYAMAASDVRAAAEALSVLALAAREPNAEGSAASASPSALDAQRAQRLDELAQALAKSIATFQQAERALLGELMEVDAPPGPRARPGAPAPQR